MPFIDIKLSKKITNEEKEQLKSDLGSSISIMHKPESYLMVGLADAEKMTANICNILNKRFSVSGNNVYVTYSGVKDWGWNGGNF